MFRPVGQDLLLAIPLPIYDLLRGRLLVDVVSVTRIGIAPGGSAADDLQLTELLGAKMGEVHRMGLAVLGIGYVPGAGFQIHVLPSCGHQLPDAAAGR